jgi:transposase
MSAPYSKGQKNDFNDAEAIAEAVQRPTMKFVATKTAEQLDLQALLALVTATVIRAAPALGPAAALLLAVAKVSAPASQSEWLSAVVEALMS